MPRWYRQNVFCGGPSSQQGFTFVCNSHRRSVSSVGQFESCQSQRRVGSGHRLLGD